MDLHCHACIKTALSLVRIRYFFCLIGAAFCTTLLVATSASNSVNIRCSNCPKVRRCNRGLLVFSLGKCPACNAETTERQLVNNRSLDLLVQAFVAERPNLVVGAGDRAGASRSGLAGEAGPASDHDGAGPMDTTEAASGDQPEAAEGNTEDGLVECPVCQRRMKPAAVNAHLDKCLKGIPDDPGHLLKLLKISKFVVLSHT